MIICIPVEKDDGLESTVCGHFGSAPFYMMVDPETLSCRCVPNRNLHHAHGMCQPVAALDGEQVDGIVVGGIGMGALSKLKAAGYQVFQARPGTVRDTVAAYQGGRLTEFSLDNVCGGRHGPGHGCGH